MIADRLNNTYLYENCHPRLRAAFAFLQRGDLETLVPGKYEIDGDNLFALVKDNQLKPVEQGIYESHRQYLDIQYLVTGEELIGWAPIGSLNPQGEYDPTGDCRLYHGDGILIPVHSKEFLLLFPEDGHMPDIQPTKETAASRKIIVKVQID